MTDERTEKIEIADAERAELERLAKEHGVRVEDPNAGLESLAGTALLVIGAAAAVGTVLHLLDRKRGGQVIDLRGDTPEFRRDADLVYGLVAILLADGTVKVEVHEPRGLLGQSLDALKGIVTDLAALPAKSAKELVASKLKDAATVTVEAAP